MAVPVVEAVQFIPSELYPTDAPVPLYPPATHMIPFHATAIKAVVPANTVPAFAEDNQLILSSEV